MKYRFSGMVGPGRALIRARLGKKVAASPFEPQGFQLEMSAEDMMAMGEKCLELAVQANTMKEREERLRAVEARVAERLKAEGAGGGT